MKLFVIFLLAATLNASAGVKGQTVTLSKKNVKLAEMFAEIKKQTGYNFLYNDALLRRSRRVDISVRNMPLSRALDMVFEQQPLAYSIVDKTIVVREDKTKKAYEAARITVTGSITDSDGKPITGASITVKGQTTGTTSGNDGRYSISVDEDAVLEISAIGYLPQTINVNKRTDIDIVLQKGESKLDEVVVQAYGTTSKRKTTSAISSLAMEEVAPIPVQSINDAVAGRLAGIIVTTDNGAPGTKSKISIRGGSEPIYVIDNVIRSANDFQNLNPNDIDNYSLLKDAAATALYGVSGGNGVVVVTTKRGRAGKASINYSFNQIYSQPTIFPRKVSSYEQVKALNRLYADEGKGVYVSEADLEKYRTGSDPLNFPNSDWQELTMKSSAPEMRHDLSVTSGTKLLTYYASLSYYNQGTILKTDKNYNKRITYRLNTVSNFERANLKVTTGLDGYTENNEIPLGGWGAIDDANSLYSFIYSHIQNKGSRQLAKNEFGLPTPTPDNPVRELDPQSGYRRVGTKVLNGNLAIEYSAHFLDGLKFRFNGIYNAWNNSKKFWNYLAPAYVIGSTTPTYANAPSLTQNKGEGNSLTLQGYVLYNKTFGDHSIDFTGVYERYKEASSYVGGSRVGYQIIYDQLVAGPTKDQNFGGAEYEGARGSYLARLTYSFKSKYSIEVSGRRDGDYIFVPGKQWGNFYAVSAGYTISDESFMQGLKDRHIFDFLKLRASYGKLGDKKNIVNDQDLPPFQYVSAYSIIPNVWVIDGNPVQGSAEPGTLPSTNYSWQEIHSRDFAIDFASLNNRLSGTFDYFYTRRTGFVASDPRFAMTLGIGLPPINFAEGAIRKEGFDFSINWAETLASEFKYKIGFNFTKFNTLTERNLEDEATLKNPYTRGSGTTGDALQTGYYSSGIYSNNADLLTGARRISSVGVVAGDLRYIDVNGDGQINGDDFRRIGTNSFPRVNYGVTIDLDYKGAYLNTVIQGSGNRDRYIGNAVSGQDPVNLLAYGFQHDYWRPDHTDALFPRAVTAPSVNGGNNFAASDFWLIRSKYVRLKYLQLGYDFKYRVLKNSAFQALKVFVSGTNLISSSNSKKYFIDPESNTNNYGYPVQRTFALGVNVGF